MPNRPARSDTAVADPRSNRAGSAPSEPRNANVGATLRDWRVARRLSQLELALHAGVSSRHLSYVETGRSQPSSEMVQRLAGALEIPLRERNALLLAAGYAPRYFETDLAAPDMVRMRSAIELILQHQEPYPAFVLDRHWDIRLSNRAAQRCTRFLLGAEPTESNMMRLALHPSGLRPMMVNWEETAGDLIRHLHNQITATPSDQAAKNLLKEVLTYPGIPAQWLAREIGATSTPLLTTIFRKGDVELRLFSTMTSFSTPHDVTLEELRIECSFPADEATATACHTLFGS
jgi:transcriptional regulator with XRE-family HTH domain